MTQHFGKRVFPTSKVGVTLPGQCEKKALTGLADHMRMSVLPLYLLGPT